MTRFESQFTYSSSNQKSPVYRTSYDGGKKQHWLSVYKDGTLERFLMKDVLARRSLSEASVNSVVRASVDQLICQVDAWDQQTKK